MSTGVDRLPGQVPMTEVGPALRAMLADAASVRLTTKDWRALAAIIARTAAWSRLEDRVTHGVLVELSGLDRRDLRKALRRLSENGVIGYEPGIGARFSRIALRPWVLTGRGAAAPPSERGESAPLPDAIDFETFDDESPPSPGAGAPPSERGGSAPLNGNDQRLRPTVTTPWVTDVTHGRPIERDRSRAGDDDPHDPTAEPTLDDALRDRVLFTHFVEAYATLVEEEAP